MPHLKKNRNVSGLDVCPSISNERMLRLPDPIVRAELDRVDSRAHACARPRATWRSANHRHFWSCPCCHSALLLRRSCPFQVILSIRLFRIGVAPVLGRPNGTCKVVGRTASLVRRKIATPVAISHSSLDCLNCFFTRWWNTSHDANALTAKASGLACGRVVSISCAPVSYGNGDTNTGRSISSTQSGWFWPVLLSTGGCGVRLCSFRRRRRFGGTGMAGLPPATV